jgi:aromatic ring hydroxylase
LTGEEYIESIRDAREVYLYGDRVNDVITHPALRNSVQMTARLYDALHDPMSRDVLTCATGSDSYTMRFFRSARSTRDFVVDPNVRDRHLDGVEALGDARNPFIAANRGETLSDGLISMLRQ